MSNVSSLFISALILLPAPSRAGQDEHSACTHDSIDALPPSQSCSLLQRSTAKERLLLDEATSEETASRVSPLKSSKLAALQSEPVASANKIKYGFKPDARAALFLEPTMPIFDIIFDSEKTEPLTETAVLKRTRESSSLQQSSKNAEMEVGLSGDYGAFAASAEFSASSMTNSKRKTYRLDRTIEARKFRVSLKETFHHKLLTANAKEYLLTQAPERIAEVLGSFYATQIVLGGLLEVTQIAEMISGETQNTMKASITAQYGIGNSISGSAEGSVDEKKTNEDRSVSSRWRVLGGDSLVWLHLKNDDSNLPDVHKEWAKTLSNDNLAILKITVLPIWYLLDHPDMNPSKARELKDYLTKKWKADYKSLPHPMAKEKTCFCSNGVGAQGDSCPTQGAHRCTSCNYGNELRGHICHSCTDDGMSSYQSCCRGLIRGKNDYCYKPRAAVTTSSSCLVKPPPYQGWTWCYTDECDPFGNRDNRIRADCGDQYKSYSGSYNDCGDWAFSGECV